MHVAFTTDSGGTTEILGGGFDGLHDVLFGLCRGFELAKLLECANGKNGTSPGAEVLGSEILSTDLTYVVVHVGSVNRTVLSFFVEVLEEFMARDILATLDDSGELAISDIDFVFLAAFAAKMELDENGT